MAHVLTDDGTLDTVVECDMCGEQSRYNFQNSEGFPEGEQGYAEFVKHALIDADREHECPAFIEG